MARQNTRAIQLARLVLVTWRRREWICGACKFLVDGHQRHFWSMSGAHPWPACIPWLPRQPFQRLLQQPSASCGRSCTTVPQCWKIRNRSSQFPTTWYKKQSQCKSLRCRKRNTCATLQLVASFMLYQSRVRNSTLDTGEHVVDGISEGVSPTTASTHRSRQESLARCACLSTGILGCLVDRPARPPLLPAHKASGTEVASRVRWVALAVSSAQLLALS